jgi:imidazole glycerol-phosphate synthase subunit HisF
MEIMNTMFYGAPSVGFENAKRLRSKATEAEKILWNHLSKKKLNYRFKRQHPVSNFIVDFYCHHARLVIEVDGEYHDEIEQSIADAARTSELRAMGLKVIRFTNAQVINNIEEVLQIIKQIISIH